MNETDDKDLKENKIESELEEKSEEETVQQKISFEELQSKIELYEEEIKDLKDKYLRALADLDNFRKRMEKEKAEMYNYGLSKFIKELLPVMDSLEMAINEALKSGDNIEPLLEGIKLVHSKFLSTLKKYGLQEIEALNKTFDPTYHEALAQTERDDLEPMTIVEVVEKGYRLKDRLLRPSRVIVSTKPTGKEEEKADQEKGGNNG